MRKYKYMLLGGCKSIVVYEYKSIMLCSYKLIVPSKRKYMMLFSKLNSLFSICRGGGFFASFKSIVQNCRAYLGYN
jgi:hypothetical protein